MERKLMVSMTILAFALSELIILSVIYVPRSEAKMFQEA